MNKEDQLRDLIDSAPAHIQRHFACDCAERALQKTNADDIRLWKAIEVSRRFAEGEATDEELDAAWNAARSAAWNAARSSAWNAAWSAERSAAWSAAWAAARAAARSSAWNAAWSAARSAAWNAGSARSAAEYVERQWQLAHLQSMISNHNEARSSLLLVLQQRAESTKPIFEQYAYSLEERAFE